LFQNELKLTYNKVLLPKYLPGEHPWTPRAASNVAREGASNAVGEGPFEIAWDLTLIKSGPGCSKIQFRELV